MIRNGTGIDIRWMLISLLFHLLFLLTLSYSSIFSRIYSPPRIGVPLPAIHVDLIDIDSAQMASGPATGKGVAVHKAEAERETREVEKKGGETRGPKVVHKARMAIPEPTVKERSFPSPPVKEEGGSRERGVQPREISPPTETGGQSARFVPAGQAISGPEVDISNFKYDYYLGIIRNKIDSRWNQPVAYDQVKEALIEFTIRRNGEVGDIRVSESSGDYYFDQTALRAVSLSNPFPPLPRGYREDILKVRYRFIFGRRG